MAIYKIKARIISPLTLLNTGGTHATWHDIILSILHAIPIAYSSDGSAYRYAAQRIFNVCYRLMSLLLCLLRDFLCYRLWFWNWDWGLRHKHGLLLLQVRVGVMSIGSCWVGMIREEVRDLAHSRRLGIELRS